MSIIRVGVGKYKNTETGKVVNASSTAAATKLFGSSGGKGGGKGGGSGNLPPVQSQVSVGAGGTTIQQPVTNSYPNANFSSPAGILNTQQAVDNTANQTQELANNPDQTDIYGNQRQFTVDPTTGRQVITDKLSGTNQQILNSGQDLTKQGLSSALGMINGLPNRSANSDPAVDRQQVQQGIYGNLSRSFEATNQQARDRLAQQLTNSGNPIGSPLYDQQMKQFDDQAQAQRDNWMNQAISGSGEEAQRQFQQQETGISDQIQNAQQLQGLGTGLQAPQFTGFNPIVNGQGAANVGNIQSGFTQGQASLMQGTAALQNAKAALQNVGLNAQQLQAALGIINNLQTNAGGANVSPTPAGPTPQQ